MRIILVGFVIVLLALSCSLAVKYNKDAGIARESLDGEIYKRMIAEESLLQANKQINTLNAELKRAQTKIESTEAVLDRTKEINRDLMDRLDRAAKIQSSLDKQIADLQQMMGAR